MPKGQESPHDMSRHDLRYTRLRLTVPVPEAYVGIINKGATVEFRVSAFPDQRSSAIFERERMWSGWATTRFGPEPGLRRRPPRAERPCCGARRTGLRSLANPGF